MSAPSHISLYTYKEGLFAQLAHDLRLTVHVFTLEVDHGRVTARFDPRSLRVDGVVANGNLRENVLSESERERIERTVVDEILRCDAHPDITFTGVVTHSGNWRFEVRGELTLAGQKATIETALTLGDRVRGDLEIKPSRWGIAPFRAMAGALKVQDRLRVVIDLPVVGDALTAMGWNTAKHSWSSP